MVDEIYSVGACCDGIESNVSCGTTINVSITHFSSYLILRYQQKKIHSGHIVFSLAESKKRNLDRYHFIVFANYMDPIFLLQKALVLVQFSFHKSNRLVRIGCHISWLW